MSARKLNQKNDMLDFKHFGQKSIHQRLIKNKVKVQGTLNFLLLYNTTSCHFMKTQIKF